MNQQTTPAHKPAIKNILPGLLLAPALMALLLLLFLSPGPNRENQQRETALLTLANTLRREGFSGTVALAAGPEGPMVEISHTMDGVDYSTCYYLYQGQFYEHLYRGDSPFDPALGSPLAPANGFSARIQEQLLTLSLSGADGEASALHLFLPGQEGGAQ